MLSEPLTQLLCKLLELGAVARRISGHCVRSAGVACGKELILPLVACKHALRMALDARGDRLEVCECEANSPPSEVRLKRHRRSLVLPAAAARGGGRSLRMRMGEQRVCG
jgi:hypothetical protein